MPRVDSPSATPGMDTDPLSSDGAGASGDFSDGTYFSTLYSPEASLVLNARALAVS